MRKKFQSYGATKIQTPFSVQWKTSYRCRNRYTWNRREKRSEKKATELRSYKATDTVFFSREKKLQRNEDTELQTRFYFRGKKSYKETKIRSYKLPFLGQTLKKVTKKRRYRATDPIFFQRKKKLQRNKDTKLQATFLGPDLEKSYKETKIQSYRPNFF